MSSIAVPATRAGESPVALADEMFMMAVEVAERATLAKKSPNCLVEVDRTVRAPGLSGLLLRRQRTYKSFEGAWELGPAGPGGSGSQRLALGKSGAIFFATWGNYNHGGSDQLPILLDAHEIDHVHLGSALPAQVVIRLLQTFEIWGLSRG